MYALQEVSLGNKSSKPASILNIVFNGHQDQYAEKKNLIIPTLAGVLLLPHSDILYCEASGNYSYVHLKSKPKVCISMTLKWLEERLSSHFFLRVHQSYLLNRGRIDQLQLGRHAYIILTEGTYIPISRARKRVVKQNLINNTLA